MIILVAPNRHTHGLARNRLYFRVFVSRPPESDRTNTTEPRPAQKASSMSSTHRLILPRAACNHELKPLRRSPLGNRYRPLFLLLCLIVVVSGLGAVTLAAQPGDRKPEDKQKESATENKTDKSVPKEESSVTHHTIKIAGQEISYTATAGNVLIREGDDAVASMFYVAYTRDGVANLDHRPVTFFYNGGPGSATIWLHMGSYGPRVVETADAKPAGPAPYRLVNNADSLLDKSDLVFIDAVSTGFSRHCGQRERRRFLQRGWRRAGLCQIHHSLRNA